MSRSDFVLLKSGLALPLAALQLAWALEERGLHLAVSADGAMLEIGPRALLTDDDRVAIRKWKPHLIAITSYDADAI